MSPSQQLIESLKAAITAVKLSQEALEHVRQDVQNVGPGERRFFKSVLGAGGLLDQLTRSTEGAGGASTVPRGDLTAALWALEQAEKRV